MKKYYLKNSPIKLLCLCLPVVIVFVYSCRKAETANAVNNNPVAYTINLNTLKATYTSDTPSGNLQNFATTNNPPTKLITSRNVN